MKRKARCLYNLSQKTTRLFIPTAGTASNNKKAKVVTQARVSAGSTSAKITQVSAGSASTKITQVSAGNASAKTAQVSAGSTPAKATTGASSASGHSKQSAATTAKEFATLSLDSPLTGKFDLYSTQLSFLRSEYTPKGATAPNFQAVYEKILFYQAKPDFSFRCALRTEAGDDSTSQGQFACSQVVDPMGDEPLEPLYIVHGQTKSSVKFGAKESAHPSTVGSGWGYEAKIELDMDGDGFGCGMINSGRGTFKMRKVWVAPDDDTKELFEGYWTLKIVYGPTLRRKGFGTSNSYSGPFWGVRALKKNGEEVGIDPGDGEYVSSLTSFRDEGSYSDEGLGHGLYDFCGSRLSEEEDDFESDYAYD
jgi:hypothetical protein